MVGQLRDSQCNEKQKGDERQNKYTNRGFKGTKKLKGLIVENYKYLKRDVQPLDTLVTINVQQWKIFI